MMKRASVWAVWVFILLVVVVVSGCIAQPGETAAEGHRRHKRILRMNQEEMIRDIDSLLLFDKPSSLSNRTIE